MTLKYGKNLEEIMNYFNKKIIFKRLTPTYKEMRNKLATLVATSPKTLQVPRICNISKVKKKIIFNLEFYTWMSYQVYADKRFSTVNTFRKFTSGISQENFRTSLVAKWVRLYLPIETTWVGSLVWGPAKARVPQLLPVHMPRTCSTTRSHCSEKLAALQGRVASLHLQLESPHTAAKTHAAKSK